MRFEHKRLGLAVELKPLLQRDIEDFFAALRERGVTIEKLTGPEYAGGVVRLARDLGWMNGLGDPGEMKPAAVIWISGKIAGMVGEALEVPPE